MPVTIPDEILKESGLNERQALVEIACRLFDADLISKPTATRLLGVSRDEFDAELRRRNLPVLHVDEAYWQQELKSLEQIDRTRREGR